MSSSPLAGEPRQQACHDYAGQIARPNLTDYTWAATGKKGVEHLASASFSSRCSQSRGALAPLENPPKRVRQGKSRQACAGREAPEGGIIFTPSGGLLFMFLGLPSLRPEKM